MKTINNILILLIAIIVMSLNSNTAVANVKNISIGATSVNPKFYIGKTILVGINFYDKKDNLVSNKQMVGKIIKINNDGIAIKLENTEKEYNLPPDVAALELAEPGIYNLKNGNVKSIENPHFTVIYNVYEDKLINL